MIFQLKRSALVSCVRIHALTNLAPDARYGSCQRNKGNQPNGRFWRIDLIRNSIPGRFSLQSSCLGRCSGLFGSLLCIPSHFLACEEGKRLAEKRDCENKELSIDTRPEKNALAITEL